MTPEKRRRKHRLPSNRRGNNDEVTVPDVYQDMLEEAVKSAPDQFDESPRPLKRPRTGGDFVPDHRSVVPETQQTAIDDSESSSEEDEEDDDDWENVNLDQSHTGIAQDDDSENELDLVLGSGQERPQPRPKRKPLSKAEREARLHVHKTHVLCLISHVALRNRWCRDPKTKVSYSFFTVRHSVSIRVCPDHFLSRPC
jgi:xeroderma pigmentosum group C-complementing protein